MYKVQDIIIIEIPKELAISFVKPQIQGSIYFGCYLNSILHGVIVFSPFKNISLVKDTLQNEAFELSRIKFDDILPRNSESYCISLTIKKIKNIFPKVKWIISFADGCHYGNGVIYRASNFLLIGIKKTLQGNFFRYIYFIDKTYRDKLTVPILSFSNIKQTIKGEISI